jgi:D-glycero-D-manno-heptose 1,7-bisphosphate phosphatase
VTTLRPAAFLDRDGTLIADVHYLRDPAGVRVLPNIIAPLRRLREAGYALVVITNQSGIARGLISDADYAAVRAQLDALLAADGIALDATYHCPHEPARSGPCECRKPGTLLHRQAAQALGLDLSRSLCIGNRFLDVEPAAALGCQGILVPSGVTPLEEVQRAEREATVAPTLADAVACVLDPS